MNKKINLLLTAFFVGALSADEPRPKLSDQLRESPENFFHRTHREADNLSEKRFKIYPILNVENDVNGCRSVGEFRVSTFDERIVPYNKGEKIKEILPLVGVPLMYYGLSRFGLRNYPKTKAAITAFLGLPIAALTGLLWGGEAHCNRKRELIAKNLKCSQCLEEIITPVDKDNVTVFSLYGIFSGKRARQHAALMAAEFKKSGDLCFNHKEELSPYQIQQFQAEIRALYSGDFKPGDEVS